MSRNNKKLKIKKTKLKNLIKNKLLLNGKKKLANYITNKSIMQAKQEIKKESKTTLIKKVFLNISPLTEIKRRRIGGSIYQVPCEISAKKSFSLGCKILIQAARKRQGRNIIKKMTEEIKEAYNNTGNAVKKKEELTKLAESNKIFLSMKK